MPRPFRFGCVAVESFSSRQGWLDQVRHLDASGFDVLLRPDHVGLWSPFSPLVAAAEASARLRLGAQVLNNEFWNPTLLAREAQTVDLLTDGRLELGFGAGHVEAEFRSAGLRYPPAGERVDHLLEAVPLVRRLLSGEVVTVDGHYPLDAGATGLSSTQPRIPVMVGGNGDRVLDLAARTADIVGLVGFTAGTGSRARDLSHFGWDGLGDRVAHVRRSAGDRAEAIELSMLVQAVQVTDDRRGALERVARAFEQPVEVIGDSPFVLIGSTAAIADQLRRLRDEHGITYVTVFDRFADDFARAMVEVR